MLAAQNKARIEQWVESAWNHGDFSTAGTLYAADYRYNDPSSPAEVRGPEGIVSLVSMYRAALPDLHFTIDQMVAEGDTVAWRWTVRGTQRGSLMGIPPTGKHATVTGIIITRFPGDQWVEDFANWDTLGMLQQIGVIPSLAAPVG
jgi:steroid delta-isomerase-like uncharacterized protein